MIRDARAGAWTETGLFALGSVLLAQMGLGVFLFLVPLQVLASRRGRTPLMAGAGLSLAAIASVALIRAAVRGVLARSQGVLLVEVFAVAVLLAGLVLVNTYDGRGLVRRSLPAVPRLLLATAACGLLSIPLALALRPGTGLGGSVEQIFRNAADGVAALFVQAPGTGAGLDVAALARRMQELVLAVFPRSFLLYYFVILTFSIWSGRLIAARTLRTRTRPARLLTFALPDVYVWPLIGALALVLADVILNLGPLGYVAWNVGLVVLFLFGLQGLGIVQFALARYSVGRTLRLVTYVVLVALFLSPGANFVVMLGLPGLGVSEIWLRYRTRRRSPDEGDT